MIAFIITFVIVLVIVAVGIVNLFSAGIIDFVEDHTDHVYDRKIDLAERTKPINIDNRQVHLHGYDKSLSEGANRNG